MTEYARLMFNCNELPKEVENTDAFFRRFIIIPFGVRIPKEKQNKYLSAQIIESELSGVFNWVLMGLERLLKNHDFTESKLAENEVSEFKKQSNSVAMFVEEEGYEKSIDEKEYIKGLYAEYKTYCNGAGNNYLNRKNFKNRMIDLNFRYQRDNIGNYFNIMKI